MEKTRTTIYLNTKNYKEFKILCVKLGKNVSEVVDEFIKNELKKYK